MLLQLAQCQLALAQTATALSMLREVLAVEPGNVQDDGCEACDSSSEAGDGGSKIFLIQ
jgi:hypothetical protein